MTREQKGHVAANTGGADGEKRSENRRGKAREREKKIARKGHIDG